MPILKFVLVIAFVNISISFGQNSSTVQEKLDFNNDLRKLRVLFEADRISEAQVLLEHLVPRADILFGIKSEAYAQVVYLAAITNDRLLQKEKAIIYYEEAIDNYRATNNKKKTGYPISLENLAVLYSSFGDYSRAEQLFNEAAIASEKVFGKRSEYYYQTLGKIASFYYDLGNNEKALELLSRIEEFYKKKKSEKATLLTVKYDISKIYAATGRLEEYVELTNEILPALIDISRQSNSENQASAMENVGTIYYNRNEFEKARGYFVPLLEIYKQKYGVNHMAYARTLGLISSCLAKLGDLKKAIQFLEESKNIIYAVMGEKSNMYHGHLEGLSYFHLLENDIIKSISYINKRIEVANKDLLEKTGFLSESEKELYLQKSGYTYDYYNSLNFMYSGQFPNLNREVYDNALIRKSITLRSSISVRKTILESRDNALISKFNAWKSMKEEIARIMEIDYFDRKQDPIALKKEANIIEKQLVMESEKLNSFKKDHSRTFSEVRSSLSKGQVVIEFIDFEFFDKGWSGERYYCALLFKYNSINPEMIYLGTENEIKEVLYSEKQGEKQKVAELYGDRGGNSKLYDLLWKPLEKYFGDTVYSVFISGSGLLHRVSFPAIINDKGKFLIEKYVILTLDSTGDIVDNTDFKIENKKSILFGGINYGSGIDNWSYLNGTREEVLKIDSMLSLTQANGVCVTGDKATEKNFKDYAEVSNIIHVATHGYANDFNERKEKRTLEFGDIDLSRGGLSEYRNVNESTLNNTGLVFAQANAQLDINGDNGILSALEVSDLVLNNVDLVVLSACETGLGEIKNAEGVYGLPRAFKIAGAKYLIYTLWKVPDEETTEFMTLFYSNLIKYDHIRGAFIRTQREMALNYDPYYWGAFVLLE